MRETGTVGSTNFNPRSPQGERLITITGQNLINEFQSTLPAGGATYFFPFLHSGNDFNPRSPQGERHLNPQHMFWKRLISIHAPRRGSDPEIHHDTGSDHDFNPRSPQGERHPQWLAQEIQNTISIHAPRRGSDLPVLLLAEAAAISIHAPRRGSDPSVSSFRSFSLHFNPRSPQGERPAENMARAGNLDISIHAPRRGSDP